jgi:hypothetical protein
VTLLSCWVGLVLFVSIFAQFPSKFGHLLLLMNKTKFLSLFFLNIDTFKFSQIFDKFHGTRTSFFMNLHSGISVGFTQRICDSVKYSRKYSLTSESIKHGKKHRQTSADCQNRVSLPKLERNLHAKPHSRWTPGFPAWQKQSTTLPHTCLHIYHTWFVHL